MRFRINRTVPQAILGLLAVLVFFLAGMLMIGRLEESGQRKPSDNSWAAPEEAGVYYQGRWYVPRQNVETVLVLGLDRSEEENIPVSGDYAQSDFILLLAIDRTAKRCTPILLNRDTLAEIRDFDQYGQPSGTYPAQLALAYAHAQACTGNEKTACMAAVDAVSGLLYDVRIDHYVTLTMDGLMILNDLAGGVTVGIRDDFSAVDPALVQGETVTLLGEQALRYVRARWWVGDSTNLERMERQKEYLSALQAQLATLADRDEGFILNALLTVNEQMQSDCTAEQLARLAEDIRNFTTEDYITPEGEAVTGDKYVEFCVDEEKLQELVVREFYEPENKS